VESNSGAETPSLTLLERVECLECGAVYGKPAGGGTARDNPGCPECGYVGWVTASGSGPLSEELLLRHSAADPLPRRSD
jgi:hypothetical protein